MEGLLAALQSNWGGQVTTMRDPGTLAGMLALARVWQTGELDTEELLASVDEVEARTLEAIRETRDDLRDPLTEELTRALERLEAVFVTLAGELEHFRDAVSHGVVDLEPLESCQQEISACSRELKDWMQAPVPLCLRCGSREAGPICQPCGLDRLVPDAQTEEEDISGAYLSEDYVAVFRAYRAVLDGEAPLAPVLAALAPLEKTLSRLERVARLAKSPIAAEVTGCLAGVEQMRRVATSREARDLNQGWSRVFSGAVALKRLLPQLLRAAGREEEARGLEMAQHSEDGISLGS